MESSHYSIRCVSCGALYDDSDAGFLLHCANNHEPALLRSEYRSTTFSLRSEESGIFRFANWLPVRRTIAGAGGPVAYKSPELGRRIGLRNLSIVFNGFWPERLAFLSTCSFKELEALSVLSRIPSGEKRSLVVSSAGNTGRAFLQVASDLGIPVIVVVPEFALPNMWITGQRHPSVQLVVYGDDADYFDAIQLANLIADTESCFGEGGAANVARRDGMGTTMLEATLVAGRLPDHYVQAVGSGTGGIAAWEMAQRLLADGSFGRRKPKLHLVQNTPFSIMTDSWAARSRRLVPLDEVLARNEIHALHAPVLSNRFPPYSVRGGVYEALEDTGGSMYAVTNAEALEAGRIFTEVEGCDLDPAAEVAFAGLIQAVQMGAIRRNETVALNVTGGGARKMEQSGKKHYLEPDMIFRAEEFREGMDSRAVRMLVEDRMRYLREGVRQ